jgi:hypothetical protein
MKETVGRLETTIDDLKKIVVAVTAASKSTDNAVTAITNAILDSQKVVITNKLDEESVRQLQNKYENIHSKRLNYMRNTVLTLLRCLNGTKTGIMRLSTGGGWCLFFGEAPHAVVHRLLHLLWHHTLGDNLWFDEVVWLIKIKNTNLRK